MRLFQDESASWLECGLESSRHHRSRCQAPQRGTLIVAGGFQPMPRAAAPRRQSGPDCVRSQVHRQSRSARAAARRRTFNADDPTTYYGGGEKGYTDYPSLAQDPGEQPKACVDERWR
jgi:N-ethylmaleimide reductase